MTTTTQNRPREAQLQHGVYHMEDVANLLNATDSGIRGRAYCVMPSTVHGWGRSGFFGVEKDEYARNRSFARFGGVVTSRMVALLRSYGVSLERVKLAHDFLRDETGLVNPFASRRFWVETQDLSSHVYTELNKHIVTASRHGQMTFTRLLYGEIEYPDDMDFDDSVHQLARTWNPVPGIVINPLVQSGAACLAGTRTPTYALYGSYVAGDSVPSISQWYELDQEQVETAIEWEKRLVGTT